MSSCCTACRPTAARRSPPRSSTGPPAPPGARRHTWCTPRSRSLPACCDDKALMTTPVTKTARQARIADILAREKVHSQEQLAALLRQYAGLNVGQATLSRDLDQLGVVRLRAV